MSLFYISRPSGGEGVVLAERESMIYGPARMAITKSVVLHVARLARLELDSSEVPGLEADLRRIVEYVDELSSVNTDGVEPTAHVAVAEAPLRADRVVPGLPREAALAAAPRAIDGSFAVPGFVDES